MARRTVIVHLIVSFAFLLSLATPPAHAQMLRPKPFLTVFDAHGTRVSNVIGLEKALFPTVASLERNQGRSPPLDRSTPFYEDDFPGLVDYEQRGVPGD